MLPSPSDDTALWNQFLQGDRDALSHIFLSHHKELMQYGRRIHPEEETIKDEIQELFVDLWKNRDGLSRNIENVRFYLFRGLRRRLIRSGQRQRRSQKISHQQEMGGETQPSAEYRLVAMQREEALQRQLYDWIDDLPPRQREAMYMRFFQEMRYEEIASIMAVHEQSVRNLIHLAIKTLRKNAVYPLLCGSLLWQMAAF
ncbi:RNA polymerase sigma-70 factor, ECF subfamily [Catalinimonas alkaloidigena]|uniref:RNA polymerase sigma-70 factor, ECF subfamily n=1 Tax=Catalinimonas alkaloidigena TaxID=1075417 RepID=A0A1G9HS45_9BACT|nr:sigma-70 family RNA polymerase sigma factor [Catalinimonas alkaloidigena]SDL15682.1 RNA polymerase sigma-70 factor, ECF subfamily [Catalinimonas alkaloidigena]